MGLLSLFKKKREEEPKCSAVIVSAGLARRMGGIDKVLAPLGELPVLVHTLYAFQDCPVIDEIVVVAREDLVVDVGRLCREFNLDKVRKVIVGGQERIHSVQAGLREVDPEADLIAIHDGARPLVPQEIIRDTVASPGRPPRPSPSPTPSSAPRTAWWWRRWTAPPCGRCRPPRSLRPALSGVPSRRPWRMASCSPTTAARWSGWA